MMKPALLFLLHHGSAHGYTLLDQLEAFGLEGMDPSAVYRALRDMEAEGWVTSTWDEEEAQGPPRRVYDLTAAGDEMLSLWIEDLTESKTKIDTLIQAYRQHMARGEGEHH